jgi:hypothetical protein
MKIKIFLLFLSIFIISGCSLIENDKNISSFNESIDLNNKATIILNQIGAENRQFSADEYIKFIEFQKSALNKAKTVDTNRFNKDYSGLGDQYRDNFIGGLELEIAGWENKDNDKLLQGQALNEKWGDWYSSNIEKIKKIR